MKTLTLPVKREYFEQIKNGTKPEEFRLCTPYWQIRLEGKHYDQVVITLGYPAKGEESKRLTFPYRGYTRRTILHKEFGPNPCEVYAIPLKQQQFSLF